MKALLALLSIACEAPEIDIDVGEGLVLLASTDAEGRVGQEAETLRHPSPPAGSPSPPGPLPRARERGSPGGSAPTAPA